MRPGLVGVIVHRHGFRKSWHQGGASSPTLATAIHPVRYIEGQRMDGWVYVCPIAHRHPGVAQAGRRPWRKQSRHHPAVESQDRYTTWIEAVQLHCMGYCRSCAGCCSCAGRTDKPTHCDEAARTNRAADACGVTIARGQAAVPLARAAAALTVVPPALAVAGLGRPCVRKGRGGREGGCEHGPKGPLPSRALHRGTAGSTVVWVGCRVRAAPTTFLLGAMSCTCVWCACVPLTARQPHTSSCRPSLGPRSPQALLVWPLVRCLPFAASHVGAAPAGACIKAGPVHTLPLQQRGGGAVACVAALRQSRPLCMA